MLVYPSLFVTKEKMILKWNGLYIGLLMTDLHRSSWKPPPGPLGRLSKWRTWGASSPRDTWTSPAASGSPLAGPCFGVLEKKRKRQLTQFIHSITWKIIYSWFCIPRKRWDGLENNLVLEKIVKDFTISILKLIQINTIPYE